MKRWEHQRDAGVNAPAISYEIDGVRYISVLAAGNALAGSKHGDKVYTFTHDGEIDSGTVGADAPVQDDEAFDVKSDDEEGGEPEADEDVEGEEEGSEGEGAGDTEGDTAQADTEAGLAIYESNCLACHGNQGAGGHNGPNLQQSEDAEDLETVIDRVRNAGI